MAGLIDSNLAVSSRVQQDSSASVPLPLPAIDRDVAAALRSPKQPKEMRQEIGAFLFLIGLYFIPCFIKAQSGTRQNYILESANIPDDLFSPPQGEEPCGIQNENAR
jgi:hypothetical protein